MKIIRYYKQEDGYGWKYNFLHSCSSIIDGLIGVISLGLFCGTFSVKVCRYFSRRR